MFKEINFFKYLIMLFLTLLLSGLCGVQMYLFPFFVALMGAFLTSGHKWYNVGVITIIVSLILNQDIIFLVGTFFSLIIMSILGSLISRGVGVKEWVQSAIFLLSQSITLYGQVFVFEMGLQAILFLVCAIASFNVFKRFLTAFQIQPFLFRMKSGDLASLSFLIIVLSGGVSTLEIPYVNLFHLIGVFAILVCSKITKSGDCVIFSVLLGLGAVLTYADINYLSLFVLLSIVATFLKSKTGVFSFLGVLVVECVMGEYFKCVDFFSYLTLVETLVAGLVFLCIPNKFLEMLKVYFTNDNKELGIKDIANRNREIVKTKLSDLSNVFFELDSVFKKMLKGSLPVEEAKQMLIDEVKMQVCKNCKDKFQCKSTLNSAQKEIEDLMNLGFEKGEISLLDTSTNMANNCSKSSIILVTINKLINQYKQYTGMIKNLDNSRLLLAEQLYGVAKIMQNLSLGFDEKISVNSELETEIIENLEEKEIPCCEVVAYGKKGDISSVALLTREFRFGVVIENVVSKCVGMKMRIIKNAPSEISGWHSIILEPISKFAVMCGYSAFSKTGNQISGDCLSMLNLKQGKTLLAISDGMGHGEKAHKNSELTIDVIENFYRAGFDNEIVLSSVNKLININQMEDFATLDMAVVDLENGFVDFIKLGANPSYVRHSTFLTVIEGDSLPLGVVEEIKTSVKRSAVEEGDVIILCSDGVAESFKGLDNLKIFLTHMPLDSPQEIAEQITNKATEISKGFFRDDVTVIVARVTRLRD